MPLELLTIKDLYEFKAELLQELRQILSKQDYFEKKKYLKSREVCKMLRVSSGTLQNMRRNGTISYIKIGGIICYYWDEVDKFLKK